MAKSPFHPFHFEIDKYTKEELDEYKDLSEPFEHDIIKDLFVLNAEGNLVFSKSKWDTIHGEFKRRQEAAIKREKEKEEAIKEGKPLPKFEGRYEDNPDNFDTVYPNEIRNFLADHSLEEVANVLNSYQEVIRIKNEPELQDKFSTLYGMYEKIKYGDHQREGDKNQLDIAIKTGKDGSHLALLTMKNLGGLGLNFTIEDGRSILFDNNKPLTKAQVKAFYEFFKDQDFHISDFKGLEDIKVVDDNNPDKEIGSFEDAYLDNARADLDKMSLIELSKYAELHPDDSRAQEELQRKLAQEEANGGDETGSLANVEPDESQHQASGPFAEGINSYFNSKTPNFTMRGFKNAIYARAGIMRIDKRCMTTRRLPDGSLAICFYGSESDLRKDGTMDKDDVVRHTKKCMFVAHPGKPPVLGLYVPQGAKMETGYAKAMVGSLKKQGYPYIKIPSANVIGGDTFESLLKACGDQLAIPVGAPLGADHVKLLIKAAEEGDAKKADIKDRLAWKMALIERLDEQLAESPNSEVQQDRDKMEGDVRFAQFSSKIMPDLEEYISSGVRGDFGERWNELDLAAAKIALGKVIEAVQNGQPVKYSGPDIDQATGKPQEHIFKFDYLHRDNDANKAQVMSFFEATIQKEYPNVVNLFAKTVNSGTVSSSDDNESDDEKDDYDNSKNKIDKTTIRNAIGAVRDDGTNKFNDATKKAEGYGSDCGKFKINFPKATGINPSMAEVQDNKYNPSKLKNRKVPLRSNPSKQNMGGNERGGGRGGGRSGSGRE